jgi:hypothetical protein
MRILFVSTFDPVPVGHGGNHRAYQILHDLHEVAGASELIHLSYAQWRRDRLRTAAAGSGAGPLARIAARLRTVARGVGGSTAKPEASRVATRYCGPAFVAHYERFLAGVDAPGLCVVEHPSFARLSDINRRRGIATIVCPQNIESFDQAACRDDPRAAERAAPEFGAEYRLLAGCDARLFMSGAEAQVFEGLGLPAEIYGYLPVGQVRHACLRLAERRRGRQQAGGPLIVLGSGGHQTTRRSLEWFVANAASRGLPADAAVTVVGSSTEELLPVGHAVTGLELRGWAEQQALEHLLEHAAAVLVPQQTGFGTLTKLPELLLAGIPVIASRHALRAYGTLPGVLGVSNEWAQWCAAMRDAATGALRPDRDAYLAWERQQPATLKETAADLLSRAGHRHA